MRAPIRKQAKWVTQKESLRIYSAHDESRSTLALYGIGNIRLLATPHVGDIWEGHSTKRCANKGARRLGSAGSNAIARAGRRQRFRSMSRAPSRCGLPVSGRSLVQIHRCTAVVEPTCGSSSCLGSRRRLRAKSAVLRLNRVSTLIGTAKRARPCLLSCRNTFSAPLFRSS